MCCTEGGEVEVACSCGEKELRAVLRAKKLRWFGHVARTDETKVQTKFWDPTKGQRYSQAFGRSLSSFILVVLVRKCFIKY